MTQAPRPIARAFAATTLAAAVLAAPVAGVAAPAPAIKAYTARYAVSYRGVSGGEIQTSIRPGEAPGQYMYQTRAFPNLFGRVAVSPRARENSTMQVSANGVRPLAFSFDDGSSNSQKDVRLDYDWAEGKVTGVADGKPVSLEVKPGTQDTASVQAALMLDLLAGRKPQGYPIITGNKLRQYRYWHEGRQQVMTPYGQLEAEVWASQRDGSTRVSKTWHAPSLGYVPVQAIQYRNGNPEVQMKLVKLER
jgi:hypothetical protein